MQQGISTSKDFNTSTEDCYQLCYKCEAELETKLKCIPKVLAVHTFWSIPLEGKKHIIESNTSLKR